MTLHSNTLTKTASVSTVEFTTLLPTPDLKFSDVSRARAELRVYFLNTFELYESLFECLSCDEAYYVKPIPLRHPLIFYFGHTATFFINKLLLSGLIQQRLDPHFESIFAVGVDEMSWDDLDDTHYDWPSVQAVRAYRKQVREIILNIIAQAPLELPITWQHPWWSILMGIEHERIHLETSSVLIRQHHLKYVQAQPQWTAQRIETGIAPANQLIHVAADRLVLNKSFQDPYYGWDNEYGLHTAQVDAFKASQYLVSNYEFLAFVNAKGYEQLNYWTEEGQQWLRFSQTTYPTFWHEQDQQWYLRILLEQIPMPWDWPVEVNYHEAAAFCSWKSEQLQTTIRLPTEDEWYRIYQHAGLDPYQAQPNHANIGLQYAPHCCPVDTFQQGDFYDVQGNVWQWTETPIYPFEGFQVHPIYDDFTTPTFDGQHHLIKGGSWISGGNEALYTARYAFRKHFFQHSGFRYVESQQALTSYTSHYESDSLVSQYLEFQYGAEYFDVPNFAKALVSFVQPYFTDLTCDKALDLGCATGRASFELANYFAQVTGLDFSARFIQHGVQLADGKTIRYTITTEGDLVDYKACSLHSLGLDSIAHKVDFYQADACNLKAHFKAYDFILASNLIDRLHHPKDFLADIHERLNIGGLLMLSSPYTWLEEHTARQDWVGGFKYAGENLTTFEGIKQILGSHFELITTTDIPFVIRETARKYQHSISHVSLWKRVQ